jgi:hypothetical protein
VSASCPSRSLAVSVGTECARAEQRELEIEDGPVSGFVRPFLHTRADPPDRDDAAQRDSVAFSEYVNRRLATVSSLALAYFLERFDPFTATDAEIARGTLLANLVRAEDERAVRLTEHEDAQLDRLIDAQPLDSREMYSVVRNTSPRHVLYLLRGCELAKAADTEPLPET